MFFVRATEPTYMNEQPAYANQNQAHPLPAAVEPPELEGGRGEDLGRNRREWLAGDGAGGWLLATG